MLPKKFRLHADNDIKRLVRGGKTFFLPQLTLKYQTNDQNALRLGFVVSTKVDKKAVVRNKVKRRMREALRSELGKIKNGHDLLFIAKKSCIELSLVDLKKQIQFALKTARLYNEADVKSIKKN
jgi:ribonuclease P protein component